MQNCKGVGYPSYTMLLVHKTLALVLSERRKERPECFRAGLKGRQTVVGGAQTVRPVNPKVT